MKKLLLGTLAAITLTAGSFSSQARCMDCSTVAPVDVLPEYLYQWEARVKFQFWYTNEYGQTAMQWNYIDVVDSTQAYCQSQLGTLVSSGAQVIQGCIRTRK